MASHQAVTVGALPPELLRQVFDALDDVPPSECRLNDQPDGDMLRDPDCPLKNISLVSKKWRAIVMPMLFRNLVWTLNSCDQLLAKPSEGSQPQPDLSPSDNIPILAFLRANDLARHVRSLTIIVCRKIVPLPGATGAKNTSRISSIAEWKRMRENSIIDTQAQYAAQTSSATVYNGDNNWLWRMLFGMMDPLRLTLVASPQSLAQLLSCMVYIGDADFFSPEERLHILSLSREPSSVNSPRHSVEPTESPRTAPPTSPKCSTKRTYTPTALFTIRPWTSLLLNENSSIRVYRTYHYFDRRPPSILSSLLGWEEAPHNVMMVPPTVTSLSYIAIFPVSAQFSVLVHRLPRINNLYLQLVPRNDILLDQNEMDHVNASDLWMERNSCYELVVRNMLMPATGPLPHNNNGDDDGEGDGDQNGHHGTVSDRTYNWKHLRRLETGDSSDQEAWLDAVEWVHGSETGWHVERQGVFVKGPIPTRPEDGGIHSNFLSV